MPDKTFLEEYPLYRKFWCSVPANIKNVPHPALNMDCPACRTPQTFVHFWDESRIDQCPPMASITGDDLPPISPAREIRGFHYRCSACQNRSLHFYLYFSEKLDYVMKVGQYPPWSIEPKKNLREVLGEHLSEYKKGLACESQAYGVGAFAYYRRIVEGMIDELLGDIGGLLEGEANHAEYMKRLDSVRGSHIAADKIDIVKELLPSVLRPSGINPLSTLHTALSDGIHSKTDEDCLDVAVLVRESLTFLIAEVRERRNRATDYVSTIQKLRKKLDEPSK